MTAFAEAPDEIAMGGENLILPPATPPTEDPDEIEIDEESPGLPTETPPAEGVDTVAADQEGLRLPPMRALADNSGDVAIDEENFPDANFLNWLLDTNNIDGAAEDGLLTAEEIADITTIDVSEKDIAGLKGIEHFTSLTALGLTTLPPLPAGLLQLSCWTA